MADDRVVGWVFLPGEGARMHRTDRPGSTLCGRDLDPDVSVLPDNGRRAFSICVACRDAGAEYPRPKPAPAAPSPPKKPKRPPPTIDDLDASPRPRRNPPQQRQPLTVSARIRDRLAAGPVIGHSNTPAGTAGTWRLPVGWVQLDKPTPVWHRPHPEQPDQVMCELPLPAAVPIYPRRRAKREPTCPDCHAVHTQALRELRALDRLVPPPSRRLTFNPPPRAQIVRGGLPTLGRDR